MPEFIKIIEDYSENPTFKEINRELNELKCSLCSVVTKKKYIHWWNNYIKNKYSTTLHTLTTETTQTTQTTLPDEFLEIFKDIDMTNIDGRNLELFLPLFITSLIISPQTFRDTLSFAHEIVQSRKTEELSESKDVSFIEFISTLNQNRFDYISIKVLTLKFREFLGDLDQEEQWLNDKWIGRALKRLNLATNKRRVARGVEVLLSVDKAKLKIKEYKQEPKDLNTNNNNTNNE